MSGAVVREGNDRDEGVVEEICTYLTERPPRSFFLFAGAGSGKTRTLVEVLRRLTGVVPHDAGGLLGRRLRLFGRSIRVVTFTKNAVAIINGRLGTNDLVSISTISANVSRSASLMPFFLAVAFSRAFSSWIVFTATSASRMSSSKPSMSSQQKESNRRSSSSERLTSSFTIQTGTPTALEPSSISTCSTPRLGCCRTDRRSEQFCKSPFVLIDESQDTMKGVLDAPIALSEPRGSGLVLGLLGDHRQRIYPDGHSDLPRLVPDGWAKPELQMNHRSQLRIVTRSGSEIQGRTQPATGVKQHPRTEKTGGAVRLFVGDASLSSDEKRTRERWCAVQMQQLVQADAWKVGSFQLLALEHKLVAARGDFLSVYQAMDLIDPHAAAPAGSGENKGPSAARLVLDELAQLEVCVSRDGAINEFAATDLFRRSGCLDHLPVDG